MREDQVCIVIPIYKTKLGNNERISLNQCLSILGEFTIFVIKPASLCIDDLLSKHQQLNEESFPDHYFNGIYGYNSLMLSSSFYKRFESYKYMLIYQLDAFVFRNDLLFWCKKGYDYIGAPWTKKPKYFSLYYRIFLFAKFWLYKLQGKRLLTGQIGNGGFSLRRISSFYQTSIDKQKLITQYLNKNNKTQKTRYNEDVFWAMENPNFDIPSYKEAIQFSFDLKPAIAYKQNGNKLPFGCHGWSKSKHMDFWEDIIKKEIANKS